MSQRVAYLSQLRSVIREKGIDTFIIPSTDPHLGEYVPEYWRIIPWLTGFSGSAATVVVTDIFAGLWTDSRYFTQAENQLAGSGFVLMKPLLNDIKDFTDWIKDNVSENSIIGLDGRTMSINRLRKLEKSLEGKNISFDFTFDPFPEIWTDRPPMPVSQAFDHNIVFCGKDRIEKIKEVRAQMKKIGVNYQLLTSMDDIMWLLNIRGSDVSYSPLLSSFAIVGEDQILLFVDESKIPLKLAGEFDKLGIVMLPYEETSAMLSALPSGSVILITAGTSSVEFFKSIPPEVRIVEDISVPTRLKAVKNKVEIDNIARVMIKDGIALTKFFFRVEHNHDSVPMSELSLTVKMNNVRSEQENYLGPSFSTIVAYNSHSALPHYTATSETDFVLGQDGILLVDSGSQYLDGTTDITRTVAIGIPTARQKRDFTLVLKGTIGLALAKFPSGTRGCNLDIIARRALWDQGLNFGHGTGHGVGFCLNVHEGPQNIGPGGGVDPKTIIEPGMLISDEPGLYREGEYGIRIENLILCYEDEITEFGKFLKFDTMSLCYIDKSLIDISLLDERELSWLNSYHAEVYDKLESYLTDDEKMWLKEKTLKL